jgi:ABC-type phosphate/phosphonate transport system permease subunit
MIYILAVFLPPLALLLNGQPLSALLNFVMLVPCLIFGLIFPVLFFIPSIHAVVAIYMKREDRRHRELVEAIERHGPPPGWRP